MIDSGILAGADLSNDRATLTQRAIAHQIGLPLTVVPPAYIRLARSVAVELGLSIPHQADFRSFCAKAQPSIDLCFKWIKLVEREQAAPATQFSHPLYRLLRDHRAVRLYQLASLLNFRADLGDVQKSPFVLQDCGFSMLLKPTAYGLVVVGPVFMEDEHAAGTSTAYFLKFQTALGAFNDTIAELHNTATDPLTAAQAPLYTTDHLLRVAFGRRKILTEVVQDRLCFAVHCLDRMSNLATHEVSNKLSPTFFSKFVAGLGASQKGPNEGAISFKAFPDAGPPLIERIEFSGGKTKWLVNDTSSPPKAQKSFDEAYADLSDRSFQNWNTYVAESLAQLRSWLTMSRIPTSDENRLEGHGAFGRRLARFLSSLFVAYECTIYKRVASDKGIRLFSVGAFSAHRSGKDRLKLMQAHMETLNTASLQWRSISFRCALRNEVQYCQSYDYNHSKAFPEEQSISFPKTDKFMYWGTSACSIPIRVNGRLWGVLELIGRRPHSFPDITRARAEEASSIIGSHVFRTELLASIYDINRAIGSSQTSDEKRSTIERSLARMFGAKTFAIIRIDPSDAQHPVSVFLEAGRTDLLEAVRSTDDGEYLKPLIEFAQESEEVWGAAINSEAFKRRFSRILSRKFYKAAEADFILLAKMRWEFSGEPALLGILVLTYSHSLIEQENWRETVEFVSQYISTITGSLYSSEIWERRLREKIAHELSKTAMEIQNSTKRLQTYAAQEQQIGRTRVSEVIADIGRHTRSLDKYVAILTTNRDISDFDNDPRMFLMKSMHASYRDDPKRSVRFRDMYNYAFIGQMNRFAARQIAIPRIDSSLDFRLRMDELCIQEVLTTLVDNCAKYSRSGTAITMRLAETDRMHGITISNVGLKLDDDEVKSIWDDQVRGRRARQLLPDNGSGFGLWFAQRTMHLWNCGLRHQQRPLNNQDAIADEGEYAWHDFTLLFLKRIVLPI